MLRIFRQNDFSSVLGLLVLTGILKCRYWIHPPVLNDPALFQQATLFKIPLLETLNTQHPRGSVCLAVAVLFLVGLSLNLLVNREKLVPRKTYLPAVSFMLLTSFSPYLNILSAAGLANILLLYTFSRALQLYHQSHARRSCFDIGLLTSLAALVYFPAILFVLLFLWLLLIFRPLVIEELFAYLLGVLTPFYFAAAILYLSGSWPQWQHHIYLHLTPPLKTISLWPLLFLSLLSIVILVYSMYLVNLTGQKSTMAVKKKWNAVVLYLFVAMGAGIFYPVFPGVPWILTMAPISILLSQAFQHNQEKYNTFTFYFLLAAVLLIQWLL